MATATIRPANLQDVPAVERIVQDAYGKYVERIGRPPAPMTADYRQLIDAGDVWVLELANCPIGLMILKSLPDHLQISNVAVKPAQQGNGFGLQLLDFARSQALERGFDEMRLFTNELMHENIALYERLGWIEYGRAEQNGFRRVLMRKPLSRA